MALSCASLGLSARPRCVKPSNPSPKRSVDAGMDACSHERRAADAGPWKRSVMLLNPDGGRGNLLAGRRYEFSTVDSAGSPRSAGERSPTTARARRAREPRRGAPALRLCAAPSSRPRRSIASAGRRPAARWNVGLGVGKDGRPARSQGHIRRWVVSRRRFRRLLNSKLSSDKTPDAGTAICHYDRHGSPSRRRRDRASTS